VPIQKTSPPIGTPLLRNLTELWISRCSGDRLPARADFSDDDLRPYFGHMLIVDVVGGQRRFRFRLLGTSLADAAGRELTGKYFDEADITGYEPDVLDDYDAVVQLRAPFCKVRSFNPKPDAYADRWKSYERLLLPLAADGVTIDRILGCSYPLGDAE
jgi:hypothetical protein